MFPHILLKICNYLASTRLCRHSKSKATHQFQLLNHLKLRNQIHENKIKIKNGISYKLSIERRKNVT